MPCFTRVSCHYLNQWWQCPVTDPGYPGSGIWCCYHWFRQFHGSSWVPGITWTNDDNTVSLTQDMAWHLLGTMPCHGAVIWAGVTNVYNWMIVVDQSLVQVMSWFLLATLALHEPVMDITDPGYGMAPSWHHALSWSSDMGWCYWCIYLNDCGRSITGSGNAMLHPGVMPLPEPMMTVSCHWHRISWVRDVVLLSLVQVMPLYVLATMALHEPAMTTPYHWPRIWLGTLAPCPVMKQWYGRVLLMYLNDCGRYITGSGNSMVPPGCHGTTWTNDDNTVSLTQDILGQGYGVVIIGSGNSSVPPGCLALNEPMMTTPYHWPRIWHGTFLAPCPVMEQWYGLVLLVYILEWLW